MLKSVNKLDLINIIKKDHPSWNPEYVDGLANHYIETLDDRFDSLLRTYMISGEKTDFKEGEFSLYIISRLIRGISYLDAIVYMDEYLKDPVQGRLKILRR